jgi:hypothetical protein
MNTRLQRRPVYSQQHHPGPGGARSVLIVAPSVSWPSPFAGPGCGRSCCARLIVGLGYPRMLRLSLRAARLGAVARLARQSSNQRAASCRPSRCNGRWRHSAKLKNGAAVKSVSTGGAHRDRARPSMWGCFSVSAGRLARLVSFATSSSRTIAATSRQSAPSASASSSRRYVTRWAMS